MLIIAYIVARYCGLFKLNSVWITGNHMQNHKADQRQALLLARIRELGSVAVSVLAQQLMVSEETIRRDARVLEQRGDVVKLHGALAAPHQAGEAPFERRMRENVAAKRAISRCAVQLVEDGDSLMIETGTTTSIFAQELRVKRGLTIVTNSSDIARTLAVVNGNKVYMAGGELRAESGAAFGPSAVEFIGRFKVRHAFITATAIDPVHGIMDSAFDEAELAQKALSIADNRVVLSDSTKFGKAALVKVCSYDMIDRLITDGPPHAALADALARSNVAVSVVAVAG
jgi:DeoR family transcriptional regulator, glycerol-3-phosphate regulon repressor